MSPAKPGHSSSRDAVFWSDQMNEFLIDSLLHEETIGNRRETKFSSLAYDNIIDGVGAKFGVAIDRSNIKNRLKHIKETFHECSNLLGEDSRIKWNGESKRFHAEANVWRDLVEKKPEAKKWMTKTIDHYDRLVELFGKDREKRPSVENLRGTAAAEKKARKELPKRSLQHTPPNSLGINGVENSNNAVNEHEIPDESVVIEGTSGELDLSELCRTDTGIVAIPVHANTYGKGLPYAPENWPCPGDQWSWRVGSRAFGGGHWADRYLMPPSRFRDAIGKRTSFASRLQVEEFIKREFPDIDPSTFFSMFIWKIPAKGHTIQKQKGTQQVRLPEPAPDPVLADPPGLCKARNSSCNLEREGFIESSLSQACNICCADPGFCRECCCILCRKTIDYSFGGYSFIKCEAVVEENFICGHVAHLDCALRCYMAGTVGGAFDLDVQYLCRRCDNKTNLMMHVERLMETCQSLKSRGEIKPILNLGLCILRGSKQTKAKKLWDYMRSAMAKLNRGVDIIEIWKMEDDEKRATGSADVAENSSPTIGGTVLGLPVPEDLLPGHPDLLDGLDDDLQRTSEEKFPVSTTGGPSVMSAKLEDDINLALQELKESQEIEYKVAEQKLNSQKDRVLNLYRQLELERSKLATPGPITETKNYHVLLSNVTNCENQMKREEGKLKAMLKVADGFGRTPRRVTQEHFGLFDYTYSSSDTD